MPARTAPGTFWGSGHSPTARARPAPAFGGGPCPDLLPGASRQGFLLPAGACTPGTRRTPVQGKEAFVSSCPAACCWEEVTVGT